MFLIIELSHIMIACERFLSVADLFVNEHSDVYLLLAKLNDDLKSTYNFISRK